ncbi:MAG: transglutaminase family protein [Pseudomonadota bacterium]
MTEKASARRYNVRHKTLYTYSLPVSLSQHFLHLTPRDTPCQQVEKVHLATDPAPATWREATDYFGNQTILASLDEEHVKTSITADSVIIVTAPSLPDPASTTPWESVCDDLKKDTSEEGLFVRQFCYRSPRIQPGMNVLDMAKAFFQPETPILEGAAGLMEHIYKSFSYDPEATHVDTPVDDVLRLKRGVCQDFAHIQIACLRALGIPARYVSGYLLTHPPEGEEKLQGADASHAWVSVWAGDDGWVDMDPTNNLFTKDEHVTLAWGRDYGDVSPINGVTFGGGRHNVAVEVDVLPID